MFSSQLNIDIEKLLQGLLRDGHFHQFGLKHYPLSLKFVLKIKNISSLNEQPKGNYCERFAQHAS